MNVEEPWADEFDALEAAALERLAQSPATLEDLIASLREDLSETLATLTPDGFAGLVDELALASNDIWWDARSGLLHATATLWSERLFTGRVAEYRGRLALELGPALELVIDSVDEYITTTGEPAETAFDPLRSVLWLYLPDDLAGAVSVGAVVQLQLVRGEVAVSAVDESALADGHAEVEAITSIIEAAGPNNGVERWPAMMDLVIDQPSLFTQPIPPLIEMLEAAGIEIRDDFMGIAGTDWQTRMEQGFAARRESIGHYFSLEECCDAALDQLGEQWRRWNRSHTAYSHEFGHPPASPAQAFAWEDADIDIAGVLTAVAHDMTLPAFMLLYHYEVTDQRSLNAAYGFDEADYPDTDSLYRAYQLDGLGWKTPSTSFALFVSLVTEQTASAHPGADLLLAQLHTMNGDSSEAERALRRALRMDDNQPMALIELMGISIDASRFDDVTRFADRVFGPDNEMSEQFRPFVGATLTAARNDPCPCGSGRKYKQCHANSVLLDPALRTRALVLKLGRFADEWFRHQIMWDRGDAQAIAELVVSDPTIRDFMVFDSPLIERFIELRADLVPAEELEQLREWQDTKRQLFEITAVEPGQSLTLRDVATDEAITVVERSGSHEAQVHDFVMARCEERHGLTTTFGAVVRVEPEQQDEVLDMLDDDVDCYDLLEWYESVYAAPIITNRDGELFEPHSARLSTTATVEEMVELLDERFGEPDMDVGVDEHTWTEVHVAGPGDAPAPAEDDAGTAIDESDEDLLEDNWIRAQIAIEGDHVTLSTTSQARHERFVAELLELLPGAELVEQSHTSQAELFEIVRGGAGGEVVQP